MNSLPLIANAIIVALTIGAVGAVAMAAFRRLPQPDPLPVRSERPAGQTDTSPEAATLTRELIDDPSIAYATLLGAAKAAGIEPQNRLGRAASVSQADLDQLLLQLEGHFGLLPQPPTPPSM